MWILFAILQVRQLFAHGKAIFAQRHMRYLLAQGLVWNLRWHLRRYLRWQWLDPIVGTSLNEPDGGQGNGEQHSKKLEKTGWYGHHI